MDHEGDFIGSLVSVPDWPVAEHRLLENRIKYFDEGHYPGEPYTYLRAFGSLHMSVRLSILIKGIMRRGEWDYQQDLLVATGDPRFADLGTSRQLDPAGKWDGDTAATDRNRWFTSYSDGGMTFALPSPKLFPYAYKDGDPILGMWRYDGFEPGIGPGTAATDLFLAVKYSNRFSVFFLPEVNPGDTGFFSSDPRLIPGVDACTTGTTIDCMTMNLVGFNKKKKGYKKLAPYDLSNVTAYWPPVDASAAVPLPPSSLFLLTGILALGGIAGIRRIERERRRVEDTAD